MRFPSGFLACLVLVPALAGCLVDDEPAPVEQGETDGAEVVPLEGLAFDSPVVIDPSRPGGEPVITVTPKGTFLVAAHPGPTHLYLGSGAEPSFAGSLSGENMLWRSTDGGKTWTYIGLPVVGAGPRDAAVSISDPDFAIDSAGNIYLVSLYIPFLGISRSTDDGVTWVGNPVAEPLPFPESDRPWLAAQGPDEVWIASHGNIWKSVPGSMGLAYQPLGHGPSGDPQENLNVDPRDGTLYLGSGLHLSRSRDGGRTFVPLPEADDRGASPGWIMAGPVVDGAGYVYSVVPEGSRISYGVWSPGGEQFLGRFEIANESGVHLWPWIVAGDEGRLGVAWIGSPMAKSIEDVSDWFLYAAVVEDAHSGTPRIQAAQATDKPIHRGAMCQSGVGCVGSGDRRLGDFLTAEIDPTGRLVIVSAATANLGGEGEDGMVGHPVFVRQSGGPLLKLSGAPAG